MQYVDILLMTFRHFMKPLGVFDELIARFNASLPPDPSPEDVMFFERTKGIIQLR